MGEGSVFPIGVYPDLSVYNTGVQVCAKECNRSWNEG